MLYKYFKICFLVTGLSFNLNLQAEVHRPQEFLKSIQGTKDEGKQIYEHYCITCHAAKPLIAIGAPRLHHVADWSNRLNQGMDLIFKHCNEGINAMPARGGCFECTDTQLQLVIDYLLPKKSLK